LKLAFRTKFRKNVQLAGSITDLLERKETGYYETRGKIRSAAITLLKTLTDGISSQNSPTQQTRFTTPNSMKR
jgi:hypothetical protein